MEGASGIPAFRKPVAPTPPRGVVPPAREARPKLLGVWDLVTAEYREDEQDVIVGPAMLRKGVTEVAGNVIEYLGENPRGLLIYSANGFMSVQLMSSTRPDFRMADRLSGSSEEIRAAFESFHSYYGRFHVEDGSVLHHIEGCSFPNLVGTSQRRFYELKLGGRADTDTTSDQPPVDEAPAAATAAASPNPETSPSPSPSTAQGTASPNDATAPDAAGPSSSMPEPDELILRTAPMTMRGKRSVGVLVWRRAAGYLGPDECFPGRADMPPPDFYNEQASMSSVFRILYAITAIMVLMVAVLPAMNFSPSTSGSCRAR